MDYGGGFVSEAQGKVGAPIAAGSGGREWRGCLSLNTGRTALGCPAFGALAGVSNGGTFLVRSRLRLLSTMGSGPARRHRSTRGSDGPAARAAALAHAIVSAERNLLVKVRIDVGLCQGHGRCYDLAPGLFGDDEEGYGQVLGDGVVPPGKEHDARLAASNCPERAIRLIEGT